MTIEDTLQRLFKRVRRGATPPDAAVPAQKADTASPKADTVPTKADTTPPKADTTPPKADTAPPTADTPDPAAQRPVDEAMTEAPEPQDPAETPSERQGAAADFFDLCRPFARSQALYAHDGSLHDSHPRSTPEDWAALGPDIATQVAAWRKTAGAALPGAQLLTLRHQTGGELSLSLLLTAESVVAVTARNTDFGRIMSAASEALGWKDSA